MNHETIYEEQAELFELATDEQTKPKPKRTLAQKIIDVDPILCTIWRGNPRCPERLNKNDLHELASSIKEIGQSVPVIARMVGDSYEVIAGSRRLAAVKILHREQNPSITLRAEVRAISDEEAFQLALSENTGRTALTTFENALSVKEALTTHYHGSQTKLAKTLGRSDTWISRHLSIADHLGHHFDAFSDWQSVTFRDAFELSRAAKEDPVKVSNLIGELQSEQKVSTAQLLSALRSNAKPKKKQNKKTSYGPAKKPHLILQKASSKRITLTIPKYEVMDRAKIESAFSECLRNSLDE